MDGFDGSKGVVILAATNRPDSLDPALLRPGRFDRRIPVELPDLQGREEILKVHAKKIKIADNVDFSAIAKAAAGASGAELANIVNEVYLASGARFHHYKLQNEAYKADHISLTVAAVERDAQYEGFCLQRGANLSRNETLVKLLSEGASAEVNAAYVMNGWATLDTTTDIEHLSSCTTSHQLVKGVVGGDAKGVFQGKIHIAPNAIKTEGTQLHKALLLTDTAEVDVKPELEIFADDVKCSHGAASGELDEEQLFYMRSRGIGLDEAKQILIDAYLDEVIAKIGNEKIREWIKLWAKANHTA